VQPLVINLNATIGPVPTGNSGTVQIAAQVVPQLNTTVSGAPSNLALGRVIGTVKHFSGSTRVTAELSGTDQVIALAKVKKDGTFVLNLPAVAAPSSTLYDFFVSGNGAYIVRSQKKVSSQGGASSPPPPTDLGTLDVTKSTTASLSGKISDACKGTKAVVQAAAVQLLVPDTTVPDTTNKDCDLDTTLKAPAVPSNCVIVASAATDELGEYPVPSTFPIPTFNSVPLKLPDKVDHYDLEISATGFNTMVEEVKPTKSAFKCPASGLKKHRCNFGLEHGYLSGSTILSSPNMSPSRNSLNLLVMAEDSGTDNIENMTTSIIPIDSSSGSFTMFVPEASSSPSPSASLRLSPSHSLSPPPTPTPTPGIIFVPRYDVFAAVQDLLGSNPASSSGHSIEVEAAVPAPPKKCATTSGIELPPTGGFECDGLGSVTGTVSNADPSTTSIRMLKDGVQIMETAPNSIGVPPSANNDYSFCAPFDSYTLTRYENGTEVDSIPITLATPAIVGTPCPSVCSDTDTCIQCRPVTGADFVK
jgi:hypothetical protein